MNPHPWENTSVNGTQKINENSWWGIGWEESDISETGLSGAEEKTPGCGTLPQNSVGSGAAGGGGTWGTFRRGGAAECSAENGHKFFNLVWAAVGTENFSFFRNRKKQDFKNLFALPASKFINRHKKILQKRSCSKSPVFLAWKRPCRYWKHEVSYK